MGSLRGRDFNPRNDIEDIKTIKKLEQVDFDFESPRLKEAISNMGIT